MMTEVVKNHRFQQMNGIIMTGLALGVRSVVVVLVFACDGTTVTMDVLQ